MGKEYIQTLTVNHNQVLQIMDAQQAIYQEGLINRNTSSLVSILNGLTTILGFAFKAPTPVAVGSAVVGLLTTLGAEVTSLETIVKNGYWDLGSVESYMRNNPQYDLIQIKMSFLEYPDQNIRFVEHTGIDDGLVAVHVKNGGGWIYL